MTTRHVDVPERFNAATYFVDRNVDAGMEGSTAILCGDCAVSYDQLRQNVNKTGHALRRLGVEIENRVVLALPDCAEFAYSFFGAMKIGAVPVPVNTLLTARDFAYILDDSRAKVLVVGTDLLGSVVPALGDATYLRHVVVTGSGPPRQGPQGRSDTTTDSGHSSSRLSWHELEQLIMLEDPDLAAADTCRDDVAFWLYTSGTTGAPNAAVHLHHDMVHCLELYAKAVLGLTSADRTFSVAKLFFAYGLGNALYFPFGVGATTVLLPGRPTPQKVFDTIERYRPTILFGVPTSYAAMLQELDRRDVDWSSVRAATSAGEPLPASIFRSWKERTGVEILDGIGTTEVLHIFISNRLGQARPGSTGIPVPGYDVKLVDEDDVRVSQGEIGNMMVRGDSICAMYWNKHDLTRNSIQGEWMRTRDKYHVDSDGYFWYDGRTNDMLKVGGIWVSPAEVEQAVSEHAAVLECAVVGVPDAETLVKPKAVVVLKDGQEPSTELAEEIKSFVKGRLAPYKYPRQIEFVADLPKTATGKIQRYRLRESA